MAFETLQALFSPAIRAKPDVGRVSPDSQPKQQKQEQRKREPSDDGSAHPVPNSQGQITGKLIDTTA